MNFIHFLTTPSEPKVGMNVLAIPGKCVQKARMSGKIKAPSNEEKKRKEEKRTLKSFGRMREQGRKEQKA